MTNTLFAGIPLEGSGIRPLDADLYSAEQQGMEHENISATGNLNVGVVMNYDEHAQRHLTGGAVWTEESPRSFSDRPVTSLLPGAIHGGYTIQYGANNIANDASGLSQAGPLTNAGFPTPYSGNTASAAPAASFTGAPASSSSTVNGGGSSSSTSNFSSSHTTAVGASGSNETITNYDTTYNSTVTNYNSYTQNNYGGEIINNGNGGSGDNIFITTINNIATTITNSLTEIFNGGGDNHEVCHNNGNGHDGSLITISGDTLNLLNGNTVSAISGTVNNALTDVTEIAGGVESLLTQLGNGAHPTLLSANISALDRTLSIPEGTDGSLIDLNAAFVNQHTAIASNHGIIDADAALFSPGPDGAALVTGLLLPTIEIPLSTPQLPSANTVAGLAQSAVKTAENGVGNLIGSVENTIAPVVGVVGAIAFNPEAFAQSLLPAIENTATPIIAESGCGVMPIVQNLLPMVDIIAQSAVDVAGSATGMAVGALTSIAQSGGNLAQPLISTAENAFAPVTDVANAVIGNPEGFAQGIVAAAANTLTPVVQTAEGIVQNPLPVADSIVQPVADTTGGVAAMADNGLSTLAYTGEAIAQNALPTVEASVQPIIGNAENAVAPVTDITNAVISNPENVVGFVANNIVGVGEGATAPTLQTVENIPQAVTSVADSATYSAVNSAEGLAHALFTPVESVVMPIAESGVLSTLSAIGGAANGAVSMTESAISPQLSLAPITTAQSSLSPVLQSVADTGSHAVSSISDPVTTLAMLTNANTGGGAVPIDSGTLFNGTNGSEHAALPVAPQEAVHTTVAPVDTAIHHVITHL